jgi:sulfatase maturation enzyme AslB (radical SAM superfamily)
MDKLNDAIDKITEMYSISSAMTYGGEPLLFPQITNSLHSRFKKNGIPKREIITNGFIGKNTDLTEKTVCDLVESGITQILLSVDAFHQEHIPLENVEIFISNVLKCGFTHIIIHPAWLVDEKENNEYNKKTRKIINELSEKYGISISHGNIISPAGYSRKTLETFYKKTKLDLNRICGEIPYTNSLTDIKNLRFLPNGDINICRGICIGNIYENDIITIISQYDPYSSLITSALMSGGVANLIKQVNMYEQKVDPNDYYGICDLCAECVKLYA